MHCLYSNLIVGYVNVSLTAIINSYRSTGKALVHVNSPISYGLCIVRGRVTVLNGVALFRFFFSPFVAVEVQEDQLERAMMTS